MSRWRRQLFIGVALSLCLGGGVVGPDSVLAACTPPTTAGDPSYCSTNYGIVESELGATGDYNSASTNYRNTPGSDDSGSTLGDNFIGNSSSTSYQTNSGFNTTAQPGLTVNISGTPANLGTLSSTVAQTATATFNVKDYTSSGYVVTIIGMPPTNSGHALTAMGTQSANSVGCSSSCASTAGTEQFGINLRANTSPVNVGADPVPIPSSAFSLSDPNVVIPAPYRTVNQYRYFAGDTIASAPASSGETDYTVAFLANINTVTPGGKYSGILTLVVTGTY